MKVFNSIIILALAFMATNSYAEVLHLKDGKLIQGEIIEKGSYYVILKEGKVKRKYYNDQIDFIESDEDFNKRVHAATINTALLEGISEEKINLIVAYMEENGTRVEMEKAIKIMMGKASMEHKKVLKDVLDADDIMLEIIPLYDKYYSEEELKELIKFYSSPVRKKEVEVHQKLLTELTQAMLKYVQRKLQLSPDYQ